MASRRIRVVTAAQPIGKLRGVHTPLLLDGAVTKPTPASLRTRCRVPSLAQPPTRPFPSKTRPTSMVGPYKKPSRTRRTPRVRVTRGVQLSPPEGARRKPRMVRSMPRQPAILRATRRSRVKVA